MDQSWKFEDGWILMAVYMNAERGSASLDRIISAADACNHAIPTTAEINRALSKLIHLEIVGNSNGSIALESKCVEALDKERSKPGGLLDAPNKGLKWLQANWPCAPSTKENRVFSDEEVNVAYRCYRARAKGSK